MEYRILFEVLLLLSNFLIRSSLSLSTNFARSGRLSVNAEFRFRRKYGFFTTLNARSKLPFSNSNPSPYTIADIVFDHETLQKVNIRVPSQGRGLNTIQYKLKRNSRIDSKLLANSELKKSPVKLDGNSDLLFHLKNLIYGNKTLVSVERSLLTDIIPSHIEKMADDRLPECTWCLGTLHFSIKNNIILKLVIEIISRLRSHANKLSTFQVAIFFVGLARLGVQHNTALFDSTSLIDILLRMPGSFTAQTISNIIWSLGTMHFGWTTIPIELRERLLIGIESCALSMSDQAISNTLWGLSKMNVSWRYLSSKTQIGIFESITRLSTSMSPQSTSISLYSLGKLRVSRLQLSDNVINALEHAIQRNAERYSTRDLGQLLHGLSLMNFLWKDLTRLTHEAIFRATFSQAAFWAAEGIACTTNFATIVYSLGRLNCQWNHLSSSMRAALLVGIRGIGDVGRIYEKDSKTRRGKAQQQYSSRTQQQQLMHQRTQTTRGRSNSGENIPIPTGALPGKIASSEEQQIIDSLVDLGTSSSQYGRGVSSSLYGLSLMNCSWIDLPKDVSVSLIQAIGLVVGQPSSGATSNPISLSPQGVALIIYSLGRMGVIKKGLPPGLAQLLEDCVQGSAPSLTTTGISLILQGLSSLHPSWSAYSTNTKITLLDALLKSLSTSLSSSEQSSISSTMNALAKLGTHWDTLPVLLRDKLHYVWSEELPGMSTSQLLTTMYSVQNMSCSWSQFPSELKTKLLDKFDDIASDLELRDTVSVLESLHGLSMPWETLPATFRSSIIHCISTVLHSNTNSNSNSKEGMIDDTSIIMQPLQARIIAIALGGMGAMSALADDTRTKLLDLLLSSSLTGSSDYEVRVGQDLITYADIKKIGKESNKYEAILSGPAALKALEESKFTWSTISESQRHSLVRSLLTALTQAKTKPAGKQVLSLLFRLSRIGATYDTLPTTFRVPLITAITGLLGANSVFYPPSGTAWDDKLVESGRVYSTIVAGTIKAISLLGYKWKSLRPTDADLLFEITIFSLKFASLYTYEILLSSWEAIGLQWKDLPPDLSRNFIMLLSDSFRRNSGNQFPPDVVLKSLLALSGSWSQFPSRPRNYLAISLGYLAEKSFINAKNVLEGLNSLGASWGTIPIETRNAILKGIELDWVGETYENEKITRSRLYDIIDHMVAIKSQTMKKGPVYSVR